MKYTEHFADKTDFAIMRGIENEVIQNKLKIVLTELEKARVYFNVPFKINSGYRDQEYNYSIGGAPNSQHTKGEAVDFQACGNLFAIFARIASHLEYDQVIYESKGSYWIHYSLKESGNRKQVLLAVWNEKLGKMEYHEYKGSK